MTAATILQRSSERSSKPGGRQISDGFSFPLGSDSRLAV